MWKIPCNSVGHISTTNDPVHVTNKTMCVVDDESPHNHQLSEKMQANIVVVSSTEEAAENTTW